MKEKKEKIILVDDAPDTLEVLKRNLVEKGYLVYTFTNAGSAMKFLKKEKVDLVITDYKMPGASGFDLIHFVNDNLNDTETVMITGYPSIEGAVKAMKTGAEEYLSKPFTDEELHSAVERALNKLRQKKIIREKSVLEDNSIFNVHGNSPSLRKVFRLISKYSLTDKPVFINGPDGTEIRSVAYAIHYSGVRKYEPFINFSFSEIPEKFISKSLFGSINSKSNILELCGMGTLYLEDIDYASEDVQKKIFKLIKNKTYISQNIKRHYSYKFRIIVSSKNNLVKQIQNQKFHEDLFVLLNQNNIELPLLKNRGTDIIFHIKNLFNVYKKIAGKPEINISEKAVDVLRNYEFPGNLTELNYMIKNIVNIFDESVIDAPDLPSLVRYSAIPEPNFTRTLDEVERHYVRGVLQSVKNNKSRAAKILGIDRKTIREKAK